jgi:hypothetical protein
MMVPEVAAGSQRISIELMNNERAEGTLTVTGFTKISDVNKYISDLQTAEQQQINDAVELYAQQVQAGELRATWADSAKNFMQQVFNTSKTLVSQLNAEEKQLYVQLLENDKAWLNEYKQVYTANEISNARASAQNCEELKDLEKQYSYEGYIGLANKARMDAKECEANRQQARLKANSALNKKMKEYHAAAKEAADQQKGWWKTAKAYVSTFASEAAKGVFETVTGIKDLDNPLAAFEIEDTKNQRIAAQDFESEKEYDFTAGIEFVNLNRQSATQIPAFSEMVSEIDLYNSVMPNMGDYFPWIPVMQVPAAKSEKVYVAGYTIDQVSDPRIRTDLKNKYLLKFSLNTGVVEENIAYSFRVNYNTAYGNVSKTISSNLMQPIDKMLINISQFKVVQWVEGGVNKFTKHEIHRWTCDNNTYINTDQLLNASFTFSAGTASVYEYYHEIFYESLGGDGCNPNKVDREKGYNSTINWTFNKDNKTIRSTFLDEEGQPQDLTFSITVQNNTLTLSATGLTIGLQKK